MGKQKKIIITLIGILACSLIVLSVLVFGVNKFYATVTVNGQANEVLEVGTPYQEDGADAKFQGSIFLKKGMEIPVETSGQVDTSKLGEYKITYTAEKFSQKASAERIITVQDTTPPQIELQYKEDSVTYIGEPYVEEGYIATDNYDGDITDQVVREEKDGVVYYSVTDSSGNKAEITREIKYTDNVPPEVTLEGKTTMYMTVGQKFEEPGFHAEDNVDGDITEAVQTTGEVDTSKAGTYEITYQVADAAGNEVTATRKVVVQNPAPPATTNLTNNSVSGDKVIYLTFDDGPGPYTEKLLDVLDKYNVKVTFFVVNSKYNYLMAREAASGHTVAMHSYSHDYAQIYASTDAYFNDLYAIQSVIEQQTGTKPTLFRFPGGSSNMVSRKYCQGIMSQLVVDTANQGLTYFDWNVSSGDAGQTKDTNQVVQNVINGVSGKNAAVVLQHDIKGFSVDAVEQIIVWGLENGYKFLPLTAGSPTAHHGVNN